MTVELSLEQRICRLEDIDEIRGLKNRYHRCINDVLFDQVADLFTEDAILDLGYMHPTAEPTVGRAAIGKFYTTVGGGGGSHKLTQVKQFTHNHTIEVQEVSRKASGWCFMEARYGQGRESYCVAGRYEERYAKVGGRWLFSEMQAKFYFTVPLAVGWATENRHHLPVRPGFGPVDSSDLKLTGPL